MPLIGTEHSPISVALKYALTVLDEAKDTDRELGGSRVSRTEDSSSSHKRSMVLSCPSAFLRWFGDELNVFAPLSGVR